MTVSILVYYPFFPSYRRQILNSLATRAGVNFTFAAGLRGRAGIASLSTEAFPQLQQLPGRRVGPVTWHPGVSRLAGASDVVIVAPATLSMSTWRILVGRRLRNRPTFLWGQCGKPGDRGLKRVVQEVMNRLATGLLVYGRSEGHAAVELGTPPDKIHVIHNAVDNGGAAQVSRDDLKRMAISRGIGSATPVAVNLVYIGRVNRSKRVDLLLDAVEILRDEIPGLSATIVGNGDAATEIRQRVAQSGLPVRMHGAVYDPARIAEVMSEATLVVAPSEIGLLAVDAVQCAVPVIYPQNRLGNGPEVEALTLGLNALLIERPGPEGLAEAVRRWLQLARDIDVDAFCGAAIKAGQEWSPEYVADAIVNVVRPTPG